MTPETVRALARLDRDVLRRALTIEKSQQSFRYFLRTAWPVFDPAPFIPGWHLDAIADHLQAVSDGHIRRLLINIPPRFGKTNTVAVAFPTWIWTLRPDRTKPLHGPGVRFLCASYGSEKAQEDAVTARRLIGSDWYREHWGDRVQIASDRDNRERYDTTAGGSRVSIGLGAAILGRGGDYRIIDDPHKTDDVESPTVLPSTIRAYDELWSTRANDPNTGAEIIIMQRLGEGDLSGHVLERGGWTHLCLPAFFEPQRRCVTVIGPDREWEDPRSEQDELLWPERFNKEFMDRQFSQVGPYAAAGQYQQSPSPRGGGIVKREWWQLWPPLGAEDAWTRLIADKDTGEQKPIAIFPDWEYVLVSLDTAYLEDESNDWSACTVWGVFRDQANRPRVMLMEAWRDRLQIHDLVRRIIEMARRRKADAVLVEAKASGISVAQELRRLMRDGEWQVITDTPKGDKTARMHAIVPLLSGGIVYAPDRRWADMVITEMAQFPRAKHDDLADSASAALSFLRKRGIAKLSTEHEADTNDELLFRGNRESVPYDV